MWCVLESGEWSGAASWRAELPPHLHQTANRCDAPWGTGPAWPVHLCYGKETPGYADEIKALFTWARTWTFWRTSGWRRSQLPVPQLCRTPVPSHICLAHLPVVHGHIPIPASSLQPPPAGLGSSSWRHHSHTVVDSQAWGTWEAWRQCIVAKWGSTGSSGGDNLAWCDLGVSLRSSYSVYGID